jgi:Domain of unknown function (DUF4389)
MHDHPVVLEITDDRHRNRLTVFFRLLLAIPHLIWWVLWSMLVLLLAIVGWIYALCTARLPESFHRLFCSYIRYSTHLLAYLLLVANPYPEFSGSTVDPYPVDVRLPDQERLSRWKVLLRLFLAIPALTVSAATGGGFGGSFSSTSSGGKRAGGQVTGLAEAAAVLGWFASIVKGRMPPGLRDTGGFSVGYRAQTLAYLLLVTDRYPNADPHTMLASVEAPPVHPVHLEGDASDLRRSRVTVFFRLPLVIPHLVWLALWSVLALLTVILQWFVTLFAGRPARVFHRFLSRFVRYYFHVYAFGSLAANPFPAFTGRPGIYPLDLVLPEPGRQNRWKTFFRLVLAIPAFVVDSALGVTLLVAAVLTWFVALATGRAPEGLRNLSAWSLRYGGQLYAYLFLLTDAYPHSSPLEGAEPEPGPEPEPEPDEAPAPAEPTTPPPAAGT